MAIGVVDGYSNAIDPARLGSTDTPYFTALSYGQTSWTVPNSGFYTFTAVGGGGGAKSGGPGGGGGGGGVRKTIQLARGSVITVAVGVGGPQSTSGSNTTVTLPDGTVLTAGGGINGNSTGAGGSATGGDLNVPGNAASSGTGGDGPTVGDFIGVPFVTPTIGSTTPGVGAGGSFTGGSTFGGGPGAIYISGE